MSLDDKRCGHRSLKIIQSYSSDHRYRGHSYFIPANVPLIITKDIILVILVDVCLSHKRPATLIFEIWEHDLMSKLDVDIGLRPATLPPIIQVTIVDC